MQTTVIIKGRPYSVPREVGEPFIELMNAIDRVSDAYYKAASQGKTSSVDVAVAITDAAALVSRIESEVQS